MNHVRPKAIFTRLDEPIDQLIAQVPIPSRQGLGGLMLLETFLILACARIVKARRFFEFGTFLGATALTLALNSPDDSEIFTLDLDTATAAQLNQPDEEAPITDLRLSRIAKLDFVGSSVEHKITTLYGDSTKFDFNRWRQSIDLVLIDGGHSGPVVRSDTENALTMIDRSRPSCILWHDYGNPDCSDLKTYLDALSDEMNIFHVQDTWLCVAFLAPI